MEAKRKKYCGKSGEPSHSEKLPGQFLRCMFPDATVKKAESHGMQDFMGAVENLKIKMLWMAGLDFLREEPAVGAGNGGVIAPVCEENPPLRENVRIIYRRAIPILCFRFGPRRSAADSLDMGTVAGILSVPCGEIRDGAPA